MPKPKVLKSVAEIPPCYVALELIQAHYTVETHGNVYSVPWRLTSKTVRSTVVGGPVRASAAGRATAYASGVIAPTPVSEGLILPHAEALIVRLVPTLVSG